MKLSLSKKNILRKNVDGSCILYDKSSNMKYSITNKLFIFLYLFKDNSINLNALWLILKQTIYLLMILRNFCQDPI